MLQGSTTACTTGVQDGCSRPTPALQRYYASHCFLALLLELQSQEAMACGAPLTLRSFSQLLQTLQEALPELEVLERSDRRQG